MAAILRHSQTASSWPIHRRSQLPFRKAASYRIWRAGKLTRVRTPRAENSLGRSVRREPNRVSDDSSG
jgi:hypothetical protein